MIASTLDSLAPTLMAPTTLMASTLAFAQTAMPTMASNLVLAPIARTMMASNYAAQLKQLPWILI
jgi:hypothetical protein